nr:alpha/beta hydrolase [uncultured Glaciecola sp.]
MLFILIPVSIIVIIAWFTDTAAAGLRVLNAGVSLTNSYNITRDIPYGSESWQKLDIYRAQDADENTPVIVFFFGGGWSWGDKKYFEFVADSFVRKGYTVAIPNYVLYPKGKFPQFVEDGAKAIVWVKNNIEKYQGSADKVFLVGHSAGAYIAAMAAIDKRYLHQAGEDMLFIKGVAGIAGPYNFTPKAQEYVAIFGEENFEIMKVANHMTGGEPPMILLHGNGDTTVGRFNQETMVTALAQGNVKYKSVLYNDDITHTKILLKLHPWFADKVNVTEDIDIFFKTLD